MKILKKTCGIYMIRNVITKELYIGSSTNCESRIRTHKSKLKNKIHNSSKLQANYDIYGADAYFYEIIEKSKKEDLLTVEQYFLDTLLPQLNSHKLAKSAKGFKHINAKRRTNSKIVVQMNLNGGVLKYWKDAATAAKELGFVHSSIYKACRRKNNVYKNFKWSIK